MPKFSRQQVLSFLGADPSAIGAELESFSEGAKVLSSDHPRLISTHSQQWVAVYDSEVTASAPDRLGLMKQLASKGISPSQAIVRFIDTNEKTFIL